MFISYSFILLIAQKSSKKERKKNEKKKEKRKIKEYIDWQGTCVN